MTLLNRHIKINDRAINYYRRVSEYKEKPLKNLLEEYEVKDINDNLVSNNLKMREKLTVIV